MKNGEGASEETSRVASPDPFDARSSKSDGGDSDGDASLSRYSSCGESEMERYCSANSVMGTSSLCSSVSYIDCLGSDFGSFRSSGFGDDGSLEGFSLGGRQENNFEDRRLRTSPHCGSRIGVYKEELENDELKLSDGATRTDCGTQRELRLTTVSNNLNVGVRDGNRVVLVMDQGHDNPRGITDSSAHVSTKGLGFHGRLNSQDSMQMDGAERGQEGEEDSFARGHSEDEDSMYNYGSDDEHRKSSYLSKTQSSHYWETKDKDINSLVMNSSVAFGSDDWDDFVQETGVAANDLFMLDMVEGQREGFHEKGSNCPDDTQTAQGHMADLSVACEELQSADEGVSSPTNHTLTPVASGRLWEIEQIQVRDGTPGESPNVDKLAVNVRNSSMDKVSPQNFDDPHEKVVRDRVRAADESEEYLSACCIINVFEMDQGQTMEKDCLELEVRPDASLLGGEKQHSNTENLTGMNDGESFEGKEMQFDQAFNPLSDVNINQLHDDTPSSTLESGYTSKLEDFMRPKDLIVDQTLQTKTETVELNEFIDDVIHEMEEILLDSAESPGSRFPVFPHEKKTSLSQVALPSRDGGLTASTSGQDDVDAFSRKVMRIDGVEVIGARQKKGNVSLSERLVGVREYTVYRIKVWSGEDSWEVERRYRDFLTLYHRLKELFADQGWSLPSPWSSIDKESRKFFGSASPDVVTERSAMIQECLRSVLHSWFLSSTPKALIWFLSPQYSNLGSAESGTLVHQSSDVSEGTNSENLAPLGKTISLVLEVRPPKSIKQMLEAQHYCCAGCHKSFDDGKNLMIDLAQTFGWGKPRLCEYTGQLYCSSCHLNDVAVLPARVLHHWDFVEYPVCQLAKSYLDSIHDQPMLCVSAVNPFLFSKVPALLHVTSLRKKIASMLPCVRCPFRRSINRGFGSRKYLLESNDFFALRDLIDLSKGAFAALPVKLETVSKKIQEHITEQCLICCDVGLPCGARQACNDPSSLIFPFQEDEVEKCRSCEQLYHKPCFKKLGTCPCRSHQEVYEDPGSFKMENDGAINDINGALILPRSRSGSALTSSLFSGLFSKTKSGSSKMKDRRESDTVILMGSLPSTTL